PVCVFCFLSLRTNCTPPTEIYTFPYTTPFRSGRGVVRLDTQGRHVERVHHDEVPVRTVPDRRRRPHVVDEPAVDRQHDRPLRQRSEEHTSELQSRENLVCRLLLEKQKSQDRLP